MSIFNRDKERERSSAPAPSMPAAAPAQRPNKQTAAAPRQAATQIASGTKVVGQISGSAELVIEGVVDGEIDLQSQVVVGAQGRVEGQIRARTVQVGGKVHGNVHGAERVEVLTSGSLEGDVISPRVVIAEGAFFKGKVEMTDGKKKSGGQAASPKPAHNPAAAKPSTGNEPQKHGKKDGGQKAYGGSGRPNR